MSNFLAKFYINQTKLSKLISKMKNKVIKNATT